MSNEGTTSGQGSVLSSSYRFRPIATSDIERYGNTDAFREGAVEAYGKQWLWDMYDPYQSILDYEPLKQRQSLRATASLNWQIIKGLVYHTDLSLSRSWNQNKTWSGAIYNKYMDDTTGEKLYAGAAALYKGDSWGLRWTNTLNYNWEINKSNRLNVLVGHEITNSGGNSMTISTDYFPVNYTKDNTLPIVPLSTIRKIRINTTWASLRPLSRMQETLDETLQPTTKAIRNLVIHPPYYI